MLKFSIIIPVYNVEKYLVKCLDSVLVPGLEGYEVIVVDDGSTDGSSAICQDYARRWPALIRLVRTPNGGLGHARNTGLELAQGEFIMFHDSDDWLFPDCIPKMLDLLDRDIDFIIFDSRTVTETGHVLRDDVTSLGREVFSLESCPELLHEVPTACCRLIRRTLFTETGIRFPDRLWFEDLATMPRLYLHAKTMLYVPEIWSYYLMRSGSITNSSSAQRNTEIITAMNMTLDYYKAQGQYEKYLLQLEYMAFYNQVLTATTRVNLLDRHSPIQEELFQDFKVKFPHYRENRYIQALPGKYKLLLGLIERRQYGALNLVMRANNLLRRKDS